VVNELLKSIPELRQRAGKLLVCATNFVETIDPAVLRPGRFDLPIGIGPPNVTALIALWRQALSSMRTTNDLDAATLAEKCLGFTPGDVELAAQRAAASAFIRARERKEEALISADDLLAAISRTKPSVTPEMFSTFNIELEAFQRI
jgi:SpoVK/Ycf46/Vps4 family AAA+-type ATPase